MGWNEVFIVRQKSSSFSPAKSRPSRGATTSRAEKKVNENPPLALCLICFGLLCLCRSRMCNILSPPLVPLARMHCNTHNVSINHIAESSSASADNGFRGESRLGSHRSEKEGEGNDFDFINFQFFIDSAIRNCFDECHCCLPSPLFPSTVGKLKSREENFSPSTAQPRSRFNPFLAQNEYV